MLTCVYPFNVEILDFKRIFHENDSIFLILSGYVNWGGGACPLLPLRERPHGLQRRGWWAVPYVPVPSVIGPLVGGDRPLGLSVCLGCACDVACFIGAAGGMIVRTSLLLFLISGVATRGVACLFCRATHLHAIPRGLTTNGLRAVLRNLHRPKDPP